MKKLLACLLAFMAIFMFVACDNQLPGTDDIDPTPEESASGLDAYREAVESMSGKEIDTDITVTGTIASKNSSDKKIYIVDDKIGSVRISDYADNADLKNLEVGEEVTLNIKKISSGSNQTFVRGKNLTVVSHKKGTVPEPLQINSFEEFEALDATQLPFVKFTGRIASIEDTHSFVNIMLPSEAEGYDFTKPAIKGPTSVNVYSPKGFSGTLLKGGIFEFVGIIEDNNGVQLRGRKATLEAEAPITYVKSTFQDFYNNIANPDKSNGTYVEGYLSYHNGKEMFVTDYSSNKSIYIYSDAAKSVTTEVGSKIKLKIKEAGTFHGNLQVKVFEIEDSTFEGPAMFANADKYYSSAEWNLTLNDCQKEKRPQVTLYNFIIDRADKENNLYIGHFEGDTTKEIKIVDYMLKCIPESDFGKVGTLSGVLSSKYLNSTQEDNVAVQSPHFTANGKTAKPEV